MFKSTVGEMCFLLLSFIDLEELLDSFKSHTHNKQLGIGRTETTTTERNIKPKVASVTHLPDTRTHASTEARTYTHTNGYLCVVAALAVNCRQESVTFDTTALFRYDSHCHLLGLFSPSCHG